jgi:2-oxoglutarate ferredoxin oxidoreductase subunit beta
VSPCAFALGAGARFVARSIDTLQPHLVEVLKRAHAHAGASFVELFQNCVVYNDGVFDEFTDKQVAAEMQLHVSHGRPLCFGPGGRRGLRLLPGRLELEVVPVGEGGVPAGDILIHDETNRTLANLLVSLAPPRFPMALGVLYCDPAPSYDRDVHAQLAAAGPTGSLEDLLGKGRTWTV